MNNEKAEKQTIIFIDLSYSNIFLTVLCNIALVITNYQYSKSC